MAALLWMYPQNFFIISLSSKPKPKYPTIFAITLGITCSKAKLLHYSYTPVYRFSLTYKLRPSNFNLLPWVGDYKPKGTGTFLDVMTTFYCYSVNDQFSLPKNSFSKYICITLIHHNVPHDFRFNLRYMRVL